MVLNRYSWRKEELDTTEYAGKYVTHDFISKDEITRVLEKDQNDLEFGEHTLYYDGTPMDVRLDVTRDYAIFFYDEKFEEELGDEHFNDVLSHFLTPLELRHASALHPE